MWVPVISRSFLSIISCLISILSLKKFKMLHSSKLDIKINSVSHFQFVFPLQDPRHFKSKKTARGLLQEGWRDTQDPIMCSYKLVTVKFEVWGLQTRVEQFVHKVIFIPLHMHIPDEPPKIPTLQILSLKITQIYKLLDHHHLFFFCSGTTFLSTNRILGLRLVSFVLELGLQQHSY